MGRWVVDALHVARANCPSAGGEGDCSDYHGVRPFLYCSGLRTSFESYEAMFGEAVPEWLEPASYPRVLVSGAGDFVVPAVVTRALQEAGNEPLVRIVDRCRTPLVMCEDAGSRLGMRWETAQGDVRDYRSPETFDLIVCDRFLGLFRPAERQVVVDAWASNLGPGGRVITTVSIYPGGKPPVADDASFFEEIRRRYAGELSALLPGIPEKRLLGIVEGYNRTRRPHRIAGVEEVLPSFEKAGLTVLATQPFEKRTDAGLPVHPGRYLVRIVAQKVPSGSTRG